MSETKCSLWLWCHLKYQFMPSCGVHSRQDHVLSLQAFQSSNTWDFGGSFESPFQSMPFIHIQYIVYIYPFIRSHLFFPPKKQNPSASHFSRTSTKPFPFLKRERFSPSGGSRTATGRLSVFQSGETFELLSGLASLGAFGMKQSWNFPGDARWWQLKYVYLFREDSHFDWYI